MTTDRWGLMRFDNLSEHSRTLTHFQTTREGGFSTGDFAGMNMGYSQGDDPDTVLRNRKLLSEAVGVPLERFIFPKQTHTDNIVIVDSSMCGAGVYSGKENPLAGVDGLVTATPGIMLCIKTADCIPVVLYDPVRRAAAAVHAGWRGTAAGIAAKAVAVMRDSLGCDPGNILAGIGAGAGLCCYQTSREYFDILASAVREYRGNYDACDGHIDLKELNRLELIEAGLRKDNIEVNSECTICSEGRHFSHRASGGHTGRSASGICML